MIINNDEADSHSNTCPGQNNMILVKYIDYNMINKIFIHQKGLDLLFIYLINNHCYFSFQRCNLIIKLTLHQITCPQFLVKRKKKKKENETYSYAHYLNGVKGIYEIINLFNFLMGYFQKRGCKRVLKGCQQCNSFFFLFFSFL